MATLIDEAFEGTLAAYTVTGTHCTVSAAADCHGASGLLVDSSGGAEINTIKQTFAAGKRTVSIRFFLNKQTSPSVTSNLVQISNSTVAFKLIIVSTGVLRAQVASGTARNTGSALSAGWHYIQAEINGSGATGTIDWRVDGVAQTQATSAQTASDLTEWRLGMITSATGKYWIDDFKMTDAVEWVTFAETAEPTAASLTLTGATPTVTAIGTAAPQPTAASLTLTGSVPTVAVTTGGPYAGAPAAATLTLTGAVPTVTAIGTSHPIPTAATLTLTGATPTVTAIGTAHPLPTAATLTLTGAVPAVAAPAVSVPTAASLTLSGAVPAVTAIGTALAIPTAATLTLTGATPAVLTPRVMAPTAASLILTGDVPTVNIGLMASPALIVQTATIAAPALSLAFDMPAIAQTAVPLDASVGQPLLVGAVIAQPAAVYQPVVGSGAVDVVQLDYPGTLYAPELAITFGLQLLEQSVLLYEPDLSLAFDLGLIEQAAQIAAPTVAHVLYLGPAPFIMAARSRPPQVMAIR